MIRTAGYTSCASSLLRQVQALDPLASPRERGPPGSLLAWKPNTEADTEVASRPVSDLGNL